MRVQMYRAEDTSVFVLESEYDSPNYAIEGVYVDDKLVPKDRYAIVTDSRTVSFIRAIPAGTNVTAEVRRVG